MSDSTVCDDSSGSEGFMLLPGESVVEFVGRQKEILESINPIDGLQQMLADRVVRRTWDSLRGQRATLARASEAVHSILEGAADRDAREVDRLAALVNGDLDPIRQLRAFPAGVDHLLGQWAILLDRLAQNRNLLGTEMMMSQTQWKVALATPAEIEVNRPWLDQQAIGLGTTRSGPP